MDMTGEYRIPAPREAVWKALNDPDVLKQCIPGCEELEKKSDTEFAAKVTAKVGPVKAKFGGNVTMSDLDPPNGYTISGEGSGGAAGFAKGGAKVALKDDGGATVLSYTVNATVGGKLAQIGSRLIDSTAKKMANDFFGKFAEIVGGDGAAAAPDASAAPSAEAPPTAGATAALEAGRPTASTPEPAAKKGLPITVWVVGVIVALGILMWLFA